QTTQLISDCQDAITSVGPDRCMDANDIVTVAICKIGACDSVNDSMLPGVNSDEYLRTILDSCQSGGRVVGQIHPAACNLILGRQYRLQVSHS
ncbi:hypothetical protein NEOLEDRAFT_1075762, partial [Neolentinus lepideus HHB14362 ss-1]